jgi:hypothetical protein
MDLSSAAAGAAGSGHIWAEASTPMAPTQKMSTLFEQIDPTGSGSISKGQFNQAFQTMSPPASFQKAGVDAVWSKLDPTGSGTVAKQDFVNAMTTMMKQLRGHHLNPASQVGAQSLSKSAGMLDALGGAPASLAMSASGSGNVGSVFDAMA